MPEQRQSFTGDEPSPVAGRMFRMGDPNVASYLVKDVPNGPEGAPWRWVYERPEFRFLITDPHDLSFFMDFALPDETFKQTGPVTFSLFINGKPSRSCVSPSPPTAAGGACSAELLKADALNDVAIEVNPVWVAPADGAKLGFILSSAGFSKSK
jgi:hypothetical protein